MRSEKISQVPGHLILAAMDKLPTCGPGSANQGIAVDAGFMGRFQVTFRPYKQIRKGLPVCWFWIADKAVPYELVE